MAPVGFANDSGPQQGIAAAETLDPVPIGRQMADLRDYLLAIAQREVDSAIRARVGASDIVQETFVHAQRALGGFAGNTEAEFQAWLAAILRNLCLDLHAAHLGTAKRDLRREVALQGDGSEAGLLAELYGESETPSQLAAADEDAELLAHAVQQLPPPMREVVWLRNWEGLSFDEVGRRTGRSGDAARKLFARAVQHLGRMLGTSHGAEARGR